jgi:hypothetical protein
MNTQTRSIYFTYLHILFFLHVLSNQYGKKKQFGKFILHQKVGILLYDDDCRRMDDLLQYIPLC